MTDGAGLLTRDENLYTASYRNLSAIRVMAENETQFGEFLVASRTPVVELNSSYGVSRLRDITTVTGSGAVNDGTGTIDVTTGTTASSTARIDSAEVGRYMPGYGAQIGIGILLETAPTGNQVARWGGIGAADDNGLYFGQDATGIFVTVERGGVEVAKVYQSNWNIDKLDGTGTSEYTLDTTAGVIFQIEFTWYGFGQLLFGVIAVLEDKQGKRQQHFVPCHEIRMTGEPSLATPNLRVFGSVDNGGDTTDLTMRIGGRQYSVIGRYIPKTRICSQFRGSVSTSTTVVPLIGFRRKSSEGDKSIKLNGIDIIAATQPVYVEIRLAPTSVTGQAWVTPTDTSADETAMETDISGTAISGGDLLWGGLFAAGVGGGSQLGGGDFDIDIPNGQSVYLCARAITGNGNVTSAMRMEEEW